jgi:hypothetical protein
MSSLPPLYTRWIEELLAKPVADEVRADCDACVMCAKPAQRAPLRAFSPDVKCCSFVPALANFLIGRILSDSDSATAMGRSIIQGQIRAGVLATPLGLIRPATYTLIYQHGIEGFGRARTLRCPYYVDGPNRNCTIWRHREAVCSTWFCKHDRGAVGYQFWQAVMRLLHAVEQALARHCVLELDIGGDSLARLYALRSGDGTVTSLNVHDLDGTVDVGTQKAIWGPWWGREAVFYQRCAAQVSELSWEGVCAIAGSEVRMLAMLVQQAFKRLNGSEWPPSVQFGTAEVTSAGDGQVELTTYRPYDSVKMPMGLFEALQALDGRTQEQCVQELQAKGFSVKHTEMQQWLDHQILVPVSQVVRKRS